PPEGHEDRVMGDRLLAVDGGGSKTRALITTRDGTVLATGGSGSSNHHAVGVAGAVASVCQATMAARQDEAAGHGEIVAACFGLAGVDRPSDAQALGAALSAAGLAPRFELVNDVELVLAAGADDAWG